MVMEGSRNALQIIEDTPGTTGEVEREISTS